MIVSTLNLKIKIVLICFFDFSENKRNLTVKFINILISKVTKCKEIKTTQSFNQCRLADQNTLKWVQEIRLLDKVCKILKKKEKNQG